MPFDIAPTKISAAEQLAALIEAGRAANPNMRHVEGKWGDGTHYGCAMTFAMKAAGISDIGMDSIPLLADQMGVSRAEMNTLAGKVMSANDHSRIGLDGVVAALRANEWPEAPTYAYIKSAIWVSMDELVKMYPAQPQHDTKIYTWDVSYIGDPLKFDAAILKPKKIAAPKPSKKLRTNTKTGATWPVARHAYA